MPQNSDGRCTHCGSFYCSICAKWLDNDFKIGTDAPALPTETGTTSRQKRPTSILEW